MFPLAPALEPFFAFRSLIDISLIRIGRGWTFYILGRGWTFCILELDISLVMGRVVKTVVCKILLL